MIHSPTFRFATTFHSPVFRLAAALLLAISTASLGAAPQLVHKEVHFTASHQFKTIPGMCESVNVSDVQIKLEGDHPALLAPATVTIPVESMKTGISNRDSHMLEVLGFPKFKEIRAVVESIVPGEKNHYAISGKLTIKGVEKPFRSEATSTTEGDTVILRGGFPVSLAAYGVEAPDLLFIKIKDRVDINYDFRFKK